MIDSPSFQESVGSSAHEFAKWVRVHTRLCVRSKICDGSFQNAYEYLWGFSMCPRTSLHRYAGLICAVFVIDAIGVVMFMWFSTKEAKSNRLLPIMERRLRKVTVVFS